MEKKVIKTAKSAPFKEKNDMFPTDDAKKKNPAMETSLFNDKALSGSMNPMPAGGKGMKGQIDKSVVSTKPNEIWPCA